MPGSIKKLERQLDYIGSPWLKRYTIAQTISLQSSSQQPREDFALVSIGT